MKTVCINYLGRNNSGPYFSYSVGKALMNCGYDVIAIVSKHATNIDDWRNGGFRKVYEVDTYTSTKDLLFKSLMFTLKGKSALKEQLKKEQVSFVVNSFFHPWSNIVSSLFKKSTQITFCHDPILHDGVGVIMRIMYPLFLKNGDRIVVLTKEYVSLVERIYKVDREKIFYCPHGRMDLYKRKSSSERPSNFPLYNKEYTNFVFFGRIEKYKGLEVLGKAFKKVKKHYPNTSLSVYGSGDFDTYKEMFKTRDVSVVNEYIPDESIGWIFTGDNIVLVLPYNGATQSGVIPIAFEYGVPVICSDLPGLREQLNEGTVGIYFKPGDENNLADEMERFCKEKSLYHDQSVKMLELCGAIEWDNIIAKLMREIDK